MTDLYVISIGQDEMLACARGTGPADAVEAYYSEMDSVCEPDVDLSADFAVSVLRVPRELEGEVEELVGEGDPEAVVDIDGLIAGHRDCVWQVADCRYRGSEFSAMLRG